VGEQAGHDIGDEDGAQREQDVLDPAKGAPQDQDADRGGGERHAHVAAGARQHLHAGGDARELGADGAEVGYQQRGQRPVGRPAVAFAHQTHEALPGDHACAGGELVEDDQGNRREREHPQQPVPVVRAQDGVRGDSGRVVIGQAREQARAEHRDERKRSGAAAALGLQRTMRSSQDEMGPRSCRAALPGRHCS
jgi:hypothetical protein